MTNKIVIIDCGSSKVPDIHKCLTELNADVEVVKLEESDSERLSKAKGVIISGAPVLLTQTDTSQYLGRFDWVDDFENPILGICFGHQILGLLDGADIKLVDETRIAQEINIVTSSSLFNELNEEVIMGEDHCEEITLPKNYKLIANSASCKVEAMQHKFKQIFGVQFHPEVSGIQGLKLLKNFVKTCN